MKSLFAYLTVFMLFIPTIALSQNRLSPTITIDQLYSNGLQLSRTPLGSNVHVQVATDSTFSALAFSLEQFSHQSCYSSTVTVSTLKAGMKYFLRVRIANGGNDFGLFWGPFSTTMTITLPLTSVPSTPYLMGTANISFDKITLKWQPALGESDMYEAELARDSTFAQILKTASSKDTTVSFIGLTPNTRYFYRVRARNSNGVSKFSAIDVERTFAQPFPFVAERLSQQQIHSVGGRYFYTQNRYLGLGGADSLVASLVAQKIPILEAWFQDTIVADDWSFLSIRLNDPSSAYGEQMTQLGFQVSNPSWSAGCNFYNRYYHSITPVSVQQQIASNTSLIPNPASHTSELRYTLDFPASVSITLHDMLGRAVMLFPEKQYERGQQNTQLSTEGLASGVYSVRLMIRTATGVQTESLRLLVVR